MKNLVFTNGHIVTMDPNQPVVSAVLVKDGKVCAVGNTDGILFSKDDDCEVIDLKGKTMVPGFNDSHMHLLNYGYSLTKAELVGSKSVEEVVERTKAFAKTLDLEPGAWIQGRGWNHDLFDVKRFPNRYDLDKVSTEIPISLTRVCGHVTIVNSKALEVCGITKDSPQIEGGQFDVDENGEPLGIFRENALDLIYDNIPKPSFQSIKNMLKVAGKEALTQGITSVQSDDLCAISNIDYKTILDAYKSLEEEGNLPVRVNEQCLLADIDKLNKFLADGHNTGEGTEMFKIGPLKLLQDGSLGARTALMTKPYADDPSTKGIAVYDQETLNRLITTAHNAGMQIAVHCIGDEAMRMVLKGYKEAMEKCPRKNPRHSIVHCQITDKSIIDSFKELNVLAHVQPIFLDYDMHIADDRVGKELASTSYAFKSFMDAGVHTSFGSDCPVEYFNALKGIYCAVTRKDMNHLPKEGWNPQECISVNEAVYAFTQSSAYASFEENIKGSITPGKLADFAVLSDNIYEIDPDNIKDVKVDMTFLGGKLVYKAE